ncbi:MAG: hypothetical protein HS116_26590 [Planctomycetes bacterium]|nr:hypothetical protein [Planctomycetota bacterium]
MRNTQRKSASFGASSVLLAWVLAASLCAEEPPAVQEAPPPPEPAPAAAGMQVTSYSPEWPVLRGCPTPHTFYLEDRRPPEARAEDPENATAPITLELPADAELLAPKPSLEPEAFERDGRKFRRYAFFDAAGFKPGRAQTIYVGCGEKKLEGAARIFVPEFEAQALALPLRLQDLPRLDRPSRFHISAGGVYFRQLQEWPALLDAWARLGFTALPCHPRYWRGGAPDEDEGLLLDEARRFGWRIVHHEAPWHVLLALRKNKPELYHAFADGSAGLGMCLSYRGEYYRMELDRIALLVKSARPDALFHRVDLWKTAVDEAPRCVHCQAKQKESGKEWPEFLTETVAEILKDTDEAVVRASREAQIQRPLTAYVGAEPAGIRDGAFDFEKLYPHYADVAMPLLGAPLDPRRVHGVVRACAQKLGKNDVIPCLSAEKAKPSRIEAAVLEAFLNGARGIAWERLGDFESAGCFLAQARALAMLEPHEGLIMQGRLLADVAVEDAGIACTCWGNDAEALLLLGNYAGNEATKVSLKLPFEKAKLRALDGGERAETKDGVAEIEVPAGRNRLFHLKP